MDKPQSTRWSWLPLTSLLLVGSLALGAFALTARNLTGRRGGFPGGAPLDDAWIHFQFARNLARGDGLSFNPGHPTSGSTAPLWTLLLAAVYLTGGRFPVAGQALSAICYLATLVATYTLAKQLTNRRWAAWLAGMVVAINGRVAWAGLSALETCLFMALSLLAISSYLKNRPQHRYRLRTAILFGLAALSRPEGYLLFTLSVVSFGYDAIRNTQHAIRETVLRIAYFVILAIALFAVIVSPYLIFSYRTSGHILPNTYHAKAVVSLLPDREFRDFLSVSAKYLIWDNVLLLPCFLFGLILLLKQATLLSLWCAGLPLVYAFLHAPLYQHGRYLMPLIPCNAVVAMWGLLELKRYVARKGILNRKDAKNAKENKAESPSILAVIMNCVHGWLHPEGRKSTRIHHPEQAQSAIAREGSRRRMHEIPHAQPRIAPARNDAGRGIFGAVTNLVSTEKRVVILIVGIIIIGSAWRLPHMASQYAHNVDDINAMHVALGHWAKDNTPPDAVLALNDIGAITYISERPIIDLAGLVTPEVIPLLRSPDRNQQLIDLMIERNVQYVVIFPNWFPSLAARQDVLEQVHQVTLENRTIAGGETMVVYRTRW